MPVFGNHLSVIRKPEVQSPLSLCQSYFLPIINSWSHLPTSNFGLYPWLFFNARLEFAWCEISIFMITRGGSFSKWMPTKSCQFPWSTTGQRGKNCNYINLYICIYIHGQLLVHENRNKHQHYSAKVLKVNLITTPKYLQQKWCVCTALGF